MTSSHQASSALQLPKLLFVVTLTPFVSHNDLIHIAHTNHQLYQLMFSSPSIWKHHVFRWSLVKFVKPSCAYASDVVSVYDTNWILCHPITPSSYSVVLLLRLDVYDLSYCTSWHFLHLLRFPVVREVHIRDPIPLRSPAFSPTSSSISLSSMQQLRFLDIESTKLSIEDLQLITTLPCLLSLYLDVNFPFGDQHTADEWRQCRQRQDNRYGGEQRAMFTVDAEEEIQDPVAKRLAEKNSPLLVFLHLLAIRGVLRFLHLYRANAVAPPALEDKDGENDEHNYGKSGGQNGVNAYVVDHMTSFPSLLVLFLVGVDELCDHTFPLLEHTFPNLTSLSIPNCSDTTINNALRLPALEELRFVHLHYRDGDYLQTTDAGFALFAQASRQLRSVVYSPPEINHFHDRTPSVSALTSLYTLTNLTNLCLSARWVMNFSPPLRCPALRCLELVLEDRRGYNPTVTLSDYDLCFFVKPPALRDPVAQKPQEQKDEALYSNSTRNAFLNNNIDWTELYAAYDITTCPFPVLECLDLPYDYFRQGVFNNINSRMSMELESSYAYLEALMWDKEKAILGTRAWTFLRII